MPPLVLRCSAVGFRRGATPAKQKAGFPPAVGKRPKPNPQITRDLTGRSISELQPQPHAEVRENQRGRPPSRVVPPSLVITPSPVVSVISVLGLAQFG